MGAKVLLHCESGINCSATVAIAYLMYTHHRRLIEVYTMVCAARPCIKPNNGFFRALQDYEVDVCGVSVSAEQRTEDVIAFNAHRIASQLQWAGVTFEQAQQVLVANYGDVEMTANNLLG